MTQYVYGKNVVKQLLQDGKPIHEVLIQEGIRDTALEGESQKNERIPVKVLGRKKMDQLLNGKPSGHCRLYRRLQDLGAGRAAGKRSAGKTAAAGDAGRLGGSS